jgi:hypothetical protein
VQGHADKPRVQVVALHMLWPAGVEVHREHAGGAGVDG